MTRNRDLSEWLPDIQPRRGEGIVVTATGPIRTSFAPAGGGGGGGGTAVAAPAMAVQGTAPTGVRDGDLWLDVSDPAAPSLKVFESLNGWVILSTGQSLPPATKASQVLSSGTAPGFDWAAQDSIDAGRY